jgi:hypothetical protein
MIKAHMNCNKNPGRKEDHCIYRPTHEGNAQEKTSAEFLVGID